MGKVGPFEFFGCREGAYETVVLTTSAEKGTTISIDELTDRIAMLGDVSGRVVLMKRDLALLMISYRAKPAACSRH